MESTSPIIGGVFFSLFEYCDRLLYNEHLSEYCLDKINRVAKKVTKAKRLYFVLFCALILAGCNTQEEPEEVQRAVAETEEVATDISEEAVSQEVEESVEVVSVEESVESVDSIEEDSIAEMMDNIELRIEPADEDIWFSIAYLPLEEIDEESIYQSRGQFIYFCEMELTNLFANQLLAAYFETSTYTLEIITNDQASFPLPEDFEERMQLAYANSGYGTEAPGQLDIVYTEGNLEDYLNE